MFAGEIIIDVSGCNSFKTLYSFLERLSLGGFEFWSAGVILKEIVAAFLYSKFFIASSMVAMISLFDSVLEVIEKLKHFARRLLSVWVNCL